MRPGTSTPASAAAAVSTGTPAPSSTARATIALATLNAPGSASRSGTDRPSGVSTVPAWAPSAPVRTSTARQSAGTPVLLTVTTPGVRAASRCPHASSTHTTACSAHWSNRRALVSK
jgi:hypothetical protein